MRANDVMTSPVVTVRSQTPAKDAAQLLVTGGFTALPVVDDDNHLLGIVTEADLLHDRFAPDPRTLIHDERPAPATVPAAIVDEVMVADVVTADPHTHVAELSKLMLGRHLRAIPIVDDGRVLGIVTRRDLLRTLARPDEDIARDVRNRLSQAGRRRWQVTVVDGVVTLASDGAPESDEHIATVIAGALPGVAEVRITRQE
jgi:CBS-domain-containing membrane protein